MVKRRIWCASVAFAGAFVVQASPAGADPMTLSVFRGNFTVADSVGSTRTWIATSCGNGCSDIVVAPAEGKVGFSGKAQNFRGWAATFQNVPDAVLCADGRTAVATLTYRWDVDTSSGYGYRLTSDPSCVVPQQNEKFTFTMIEVA
jgi:hypothetical protein